MWEVAESVDHHCGVERWPSYGVYQLGKIMGVTKDLRIFLTHIYVVSGVWWVAFHYDIGTQAPLSSMLLFSRSLRDFPQILHNRPENEGRERIQRFSRETLGGVYITLSTFHWQESSLLANLPSGEAEKIPGNFSRL